LFFALLVFLSKYTGRVVDADDMPFTRLKNYDRVYTELWLVLTLGFPFILLYIAAYSLVNNWGSFYLLANNSEMSALLLAGGYAYIFILTFSLFYYGLARRIKAKNLWEDSLAKLLFGQLRRLLRAMKKLVLYAFDNPNLLVRFMAPLIGILIFHVIMLITIVASQYELTQFLLIIFTLAIDIFIGTMLFISAKARETIVAGIKKISSGDIHHKVEEKGLHADNLVLAKAVNSIGDSISTAVEISMRDERLKADLITNVSHDIKTPLTSIINYIDLIKREEITDEPIKNYIDILDSKSQRLKQLTDDLVEASKISSGNIEFKMEKINLTELVNQTIGEFEEKFSQSSLQIVFKSLSEHFEIEADSRRIWRVIENLFNNIYKYAMPGTRVYIEIAEKISGQIELSLKNISEQPLNFNADELTGRFIRGDVSRSTEGSGLGLSIAKSLTEAQNGRFEIQMDGDLFKVMLMFPLLLKD
jgi:signal transduction histidine kinase